MRNALLKTASALAASFLFASLALAGEGQPTIEVALLDMTSLMGPGQMGQGMMYPGQMGESLMGQGMMGQDMVGRGMISRGMMGQGTVGRGMTGPGIMSMRVRPSSAKSGKVTFEVTNLSQSIVHEMKIVAVDNADVALPYDFSMFRVAEDQVTIAGNTQELSVNSKKVFEVTLAPGSYLLLCNVPGHYAAGMVASFTATP